MGRAGVYPQPLHQKSSRNLELFLLSKFEGVTPRAPVKANPRGHGCLTAAAAEAAAKHCEAALRDDLATGEWPCCPRAES